MTFREEFEARFMPDGPSIMMVNFSMQDIETFVTDWFKEKLDTIEDSLFTEGGFLREDENVPSDILSKIEKLKKEL